MVHIVRLSAWALVIEFSPLHAGNVTMLRRRDGRGKGTSGKRDEADSKNKAHGINRKWS